MNIALVLAGGTGTRLGADIPKQYIEVDGRMVIDYCLETLDAATIRTARILADISPAAAFSRLASSSLSSRPG